MLKRTGDPGGRKTGIELLDKFGIGPAVLLAAAGILLPALIALVFITVFGVNVVNYDQYEFIPLIDKLYNGTLTFGDIYTQHNEHRILFPRLVMLGLMSATHYNTMAEMYFSWALAGVSLGLIFALYRKQTGKSAPLLLGFIPVAWLIFNLRQVDNLLWGWQLQIFMSVTAFILALFFLDCSKGVDRQFGAAALSAVVSTFSFVNGLLVWPACLAFLLMRKGKAGVRESLLWGFGGAAIWVLYFIGWSSPSNHPSVLYVLNNVPGGMIYLLANIGSPLAFEKSHAVAVGAVLLVTMIAVLAALAWKKEIPANATWITLAIFSLASSAACVVGRSGFGVDQALSPRYVTFTSLAVIGLYIIMACKFFGGDFSRPKSTAVTLGYGALTGIIVVGLITGMIGGIYFGISDHANKTAMKKTLTDYRSASDTDLEKLYPLPEKVRDGAAILEKYRLNAFSRTDGGRP